MTTQEFSEIQGWLYPEEISYLQAMYDDVRTDDMLMSIRAMQSLAEHGIVNLRRTFGESTLTPIGRQFVEWMRTG